MAQMQTRQVPSPPLMRIEPFKGINLSVTPTQIDNSQSPDMLNMHTDERGALIKRTGYRRVIPQSIGEGSVNGMFVFPKQDGSREFLFAHGTKLYKTNALPDAGTQPSVWSDDDLSQNWGD
ncbi:hypothetical protein [Bacillus sp. NTK034]|uniref:hypothetical protein n=1 Tax=Bacillus sp. NTK034 TaxID=2802176 RepID=UPI001A8CE1F7|nr:hypothetical protein [Bacillus sp. NTK034]MBN8200480.1 hypothetical protein [Bacillus sp. NTK034]